MSETATPTPPSTAAQVSPILKRVEKHGIGARDGDLVGLRLPEPAEGLANAHDLFECRCHVPILPC